MCRSCHTGMDAHAAGLGPATPRARPIPRLPNPPRRARAGSSSPVRRPGDRPGIPAATHGGRGLAGLFAVSMLSAVLASTGTARPGGAGNEGATAPSPTAAGRTVTTVETADDITGVVAAARKSVVTITADGLATNSFSPFAVPTTGVGSGRHPDRRRLHPDQPPRRREQPEADRRVLRRARAPGDDREDLRHDGPGADQGRRHGSRAPHRSGTRRRSRSARPRSRSAARSARTPRPSLAASSPASTARSRSSDEQTRRRDDPIGPDPDRRRDQPGQQRRSAPRRSPARSSASTPRSRRAPRASASRSRSARQATSSTSPRSAPAPDRVRPPGSPLDRVPTHGGSMRLKVFAIVVLLVVAGGAVFFAARGGLAPAATAARPS